MKCYICAQQGKKTDAVGVCIVCGMAVCREHMIREETPIWDYVWNMLTEQTWRYGKVNIPYL